MITRCVLGLTLAVLAIELNAQGVVAAQTYPARPITLIVPFAAGGADRHHRAHRNRTHAGVSWSTHYH
jgi:tripartite-type tricarboxylate transporter receptor subunit TctC